jgi:hypothetical protein
MGKSRWSLVFDQWSFNVYLSLFRGPNPILLKVAVKSLIRLNQDVEIELLSPNLDVTENDHSLMSLFKLRVWPL